MRIGPALISSTDPGLSVELALFTRARADCIRIPTGTGFLNPPAAVEAFIGAGARLVVLNVEKYWPDGARPDVEQGHGVQTELAPYLPVIDRHPDVAFVAELANEEDRVPAVSVAQARAWLLATLQYVAPTLHRKNLDWSISLPTTEAATAQLLARDTRGCVLDHITVLCTHLYGYTQLGDGGNTDELAILHDELVGTNLPIILTEVGIDDRGTPPAEKARRYLAWASTADPRVEAMCLWDLGNWNPNPTYNWTPELADVLAGREAHFEGGPTPPPTPPAPPVKPVPPADPFAYTDPVTKYVVRDGMLARYNQLRRALSVISPDEVLLVIGRPVENEHADPDGFTRQRFEHVTLTWKHAQSPPRFDILEEIVNPFRTMP